MIIILIFNFVMIVKILYLHPPSTCKFKIYNMMYNTVTNLRKYHLRGTNIAACHHQFTNTTEIDVVIDYDVNLKENSMCLKSI